MHPDKNRLKNHVEGILDESSNIDIRRHLAVCEFCQEFCENYKNLLASAQFAEEEIIPPKGRQLAAKLYDAAIRISSIPLILYERDPEKAESLFLMAADGEKREIPILDNLANLYSENPEVVMRIMRDNGKNEEFLQLISDDQALVSHVMIQLPELNKSFITDGEGIASIDPDTARDCQELKWQIKLPSTMFELEPLVYDPEKIESFRETVLENEKGDKIEVMLLKKTEGLEISFRVLQLEGDKEYQGLKAIVTQDKDSKIYDLVPSKEAVYRLGDTEDLIKIRLFPK